jgi:PRTRC genetic system protein C
MALQVTTLPRVFQFKNEALSDPDVNMPPHDVMEFYAARFPELTTGTVKGPKIDEEKNQAIYEFVTTAGVKG